MEFLRKHVDIVANYKNKKELATILKKNKFQCYFDNVGEDLLDFVMLFIANHGRIALCGAISNYKNQKDMGINNVGLAISKRLTLQGLAFISLMQRAIEIFKQFDGLELPLAEVKMEDFETHFSQILQSGNKIIGKVIVDLQ